MGIPGRHSQPQSRGSVGVSPGTVDAPSLRPPSIFLYIFCQQPKELERKIGGLSPPRMVSPDIGSDARGITRTRPSRTAARVPRLGRGPVSNLTMESVRTLVSRVVALATAAGQRSRT